MQVAVRRPVAAATDVRDTLVRSSLKLSAQYETSGYWIDYGVSHPTQPGRHVLAIECDGASYHSAESARDRDRLRQEQLERLGWRFHRIWSSEWFYDKDKSVEKVLEAYRRAVEAADREDDPEAEQLNVPQTDLEPEQSVSSERNGRRPPVLRRGRPIGDYKQAQLVAVVRWIEPDDLVRTEDELTDEVAREIGKRRGKSVVAAITSAIQQARQ